MFIRRLPRFEYHSPASIPEALELLSTYGRDAKLMAGGTDLLVAMKKRTTTPGHLVNLKTIPGLTGITPSEDGLTIGALTTMAEILRSPVIRESYSPLWDAASVMASPQVRTLATVGGNLVSAVPSADTAPPLMALSAQAHVTGPSGERTCPVKDLFSGPSECSIDPQEVLTHITLPVAKGQGVYLKTMRRAALDLALAGVAAFLSVDSGGVCTDVKIALGAVAPTPMRAGLAEGILRGNAFSESRVEEAAKSAAEECRPISDLRASEGYRRNLVEVLTRRALLQSFNTLHQGGTR